MLLLDFLAVFSGPDPFLVLAMLFRETVRIFQRTISGTTIEQNTKLKLLRSSTNSRTLVPPYWPRANWKLVTEATSFPVSSPYPKHEHRTSLHAVKFELTNQHSVGGKNCGVLTSRSFCALRCLFASISARSAKFILWKCSFISAFSSNLPLAFSL